MKPLLLVAALACASVIASEPSSSPMEVVQSRLERLKMKLPVTYKTNSAEIYCTVHCGDQNERRAVYDVFADVNTLGLTASSDPPAVCVVMVFDPAKYEDKERVKALTNNLEQTRATIRGKVVAKISEGLLVRLEDADRMILVLDAPGEYVDDDPFQSDCYYLGENFEYQQPNAGARTVRKYTCSRKAAAERWTPLSAVQARSETRSRMTQ